MGGFVVFWVGKSGKSRRSSYVVMRRGWVRLGVAWRSGHGMVGRGSARRSRVVCYVQFSSVQSTARRSS